MNKITFIGAFSQGKITQKWFDTFPLLGNNVQAIIIQYLNKDSEFDPISVPQNVILIKYKKRYPGNTGKHKDFHELISPYLEEDTRYFVTDMHDVVFQALLPQLNDKSPYIVSEGKKFNEVDFWTQLLPKQFHTMEMYNVGTFSLMGKDLKAFWEYVYNQWMEFYDWYKQGTIPRIGNGDIFPFNIPFHEKIKIDMAVTFNAYADTLLFNQFIYKRDRIEIFTLFGCYAYQVEMGIVEDRHGKLYRDNKLISIVHYNGDSKKHLKGGE